MKTKGAVTVDRRYVSKHSSLSCKEWKHRDLPKAKAFFKSVFSILHLSIDHYIYKKEALAHIYFQVIFLNLTALLDKIFKSIH